jgi:hypothetical protein
MPVARNQKNSLKRKHSSTKFTFIKQKNTCRRTTINMVVENLAASLKDLLHKELSFTLGVLESVHTVERSFRGLLVEKKSQIYCRIQDLERKTMPDSSDSDRTYDTDLSDNQVPSEDENCVTRVPATDDEDSSVVVLSEDNKRPLQQSSSHRSSTTRAQELCCLALKESIPPY